MLTPSVQDAFRRYHVVIRGGADLTADSYLAAARRYFTWHKKQDLTPSPKTTEQWLEHLYTSEQNHSNATRANRLSGVRAVCQFLIRSKILDSNPTDGVPSPKFYKKQANKFSSNELRLLFSAPNIATDIGMRDRAILAMFYAAGLRRSEMCDLTMDNLKLGHASGRLMINGKGSKERTVSFEGKKLVEALVLWLQARSRYAVKGCPYVFVSVTGRAKGTRLAIYGMADVIKRAGKAVGLRNEGVFLHKLRATYATSLYDSGKDIKVIQILMGHEKPETTMGYIAISERHLKTARLPGSHVDGLL